MAHRDGATMLSSPTGLVAVELQSSSMPQPNTLSIQVTDSSKYTFGFNSMVISITISFRIPAEVQLSSNVEAHRDQTTMLMTSKTDNPVQDAESSPNVQVDDAVAESAAEKSQPVNNAGSSNTEEANSG